MTGPLENSEFCSPRISMFEILGKQNSLFPSGSVTKCLLLCSPGWLNWETYVSDTKFLSGKQKCFCLHGKDIFCFRAEKFVSATNVSLAAKLGNICIRNIVSATMFPSLARPTTTTTATRTSQTCIFDSEKQ